MQSIAQEPQGYADVDARAHWLPTRVVLHHRAFPQVHLDQFPGTPNVTNSRGVTPQPIALWPESDSLVPHKGFGAQAKDHEEGMRLSLHRAHVHLGAVLLGVSFFFNFNRILPICMG